MIVLPTDKGNISLGPVALLRTSKWLAYCAVADLLFCNDQISSGPKSPILHLVQVSPSTWVSKTFRLTENNLFSYHLGLHAQTF